MLYTITQKGCVVHNDFLNQTDTWLWDQWCMRVTKNRWEWVLDLRPPKTQTLRKMKTRLTLTFIIKLAWEILALGFLRDNTIHIGVSLLNIILLIKSPLCCDTSFIVVTAFWNIWEDSVSTWLCECNYWLIADFPRLCRGPLHTPRFFSFIVVQIYVVFLQFCYIYSTIIHLCIFDLLCY